MKKIDSKTNKKMFFQSKEANLLFSKLQIMYAIKYSIMIVSFVVMFLLIKDTEKPSTFSGWLSLGWNWSLLFLFGVASWNISKIVLDSFNQSYFSVFYVLSLLGYGLVLYFIAKDSVLTSPSEYIKLLEYAIFPMVIPIFKHAIGVYVNRRISPLVARYELIKFVAVSLLMYSLAMSYTLIALFLLRSDNVFRYDDLIPAIALTTLPFTVLWGMGLYSYAISKDLKVQFSTWDKDKVKVVLIPIFMSVSLWFFQSTFTFSYSIPVVVYIIVVTLISLLVLYYSLYSSGEISSSNISTTIYGLALVVLWFMPFLYVTMYGYMYNINTLINLSAIGTSLILISIIASDTSFTRTQTYAFAGLVIFLASTLFGYWFVESIDLDMSELPMDLDILMLIIFAIFPIGFLQSGIWKIFINQISLNYYMKNERKNNKTTLKEKLTFKKENL